MSLCVNEEEHAGEEVIYKHWHQYYNENEQWFLLTQKKSPPHNYPPPDFTVFFTHWEDNNSPFLLLTNLLQSDLNKLNLDSLLKWTIFYCSPVHTICSLAKSKQTFWFFFEIKGLRHGIRATNFSLFNLQETVFLKTGFPFYLQNTQEIKVAVLKRSFKTNLTIIWSSGLEVIGGLTAFSSQLIYC